ncbi:MAG: hypothetical protein Q8S73_40385 [Deltaproteobacteria bacterium]|nr:hypothetical protein [Deltaproteobacteria bacterium]
MTERSSVRPAAPGLPDLALDKLTRVLGAEKGRRVYGDVLSDAGLTEILTADDLYVFSEHLSRLGGFEAAVGGLLGVDAVLRGASARPQVA